MLSRRISNNTGSVLFNDKALGANEVKQICCYIQQSDMFYGFLTVEEHLDCVVSLTGQNLEILASFLMATYNSCGGNPIRRRSPNRYRTSRHGGASCRCRKAIRLHLSPIFPWLSQARLRTGRTEQRSKLVDYLLELYGLVKVKNSRIGNIQMAAKRLVLESLHAACTSTAENKY